MSLSEIYRCARSLEAIENYARSDELALSTANEVKKEGVGDYFVDTDEKFWMSILRNPGIFWGQNFQVFMFVLSEWVPRVPGLYWAPGSKALRQLAANAVEYRSPGFITYRPHGKSQIVLGGVGTLKLPPQDGYHLVSLSAGHNASSGIPVLISPDVWGHYHLQEGTYLDVSASWQKMSLGWAERFPSIRGIPRGYLAITSPDQVHGIPAKDAPIEFHPFTVMEYSAGSARLFDFVYATADTRVENCRSRIENFFESYKSRQNRYGRYLLSADISDPLWEAEFDSPAALRAIVPGAKAQLELLESRVREEGFRGKSIETILQLLTDNFDNETLIRYATQIQIPSSQWSTKAAVSNSAAEFLNLCVARRKVDELLDVIGLEYPQLIMQEG